MRLRAESFSRHLFRDGYDRRVKKKKGAFTSEFNLSETSIKKKSSAVIYLSSIFSHYFQKNNKKFRLITFEYRGSEL